MTTAAQLGLATPTGDDYMSGGDDAITQNAHALALRYDEHKADLAAQKYSRPVLNSTHDLNTTTATGFYPVANSSQPANMPPGVTAAGVWVGDLKNSTGNLQVQMVISYGPLAMWIRDRNTAGYWQAWKKQGTDDPTLADSGAGRRDAVVDAGIKRRGGVIGTNGVAAVALRFDHHLPNFKAKVLPLLKKYRLPWGQMLNPRTVQTGAEGMTFAEIATECYISGGEVWNHSWSHSDITLEGTAVREVTQGLTDLRAGLPGLYIDGWAGPGQTQLMGMEGSDTPEKFWGTYPGRLVLAQHAFIRGYYPGIYQPMAGPNLVGAPHSTIDTLDAAYVSGIVRGAQSAGAGLTLMLHPNYLDTAGYMTTAALETVLAEIAGYRDAGTLVVLSPTAILLADASTGYRRNLLQTGAAGTTNGTWTETVTTRASMAQYGVPHELTVQVKAKANGNVVLDLMETGTAPRFNQRHAVYLATGQTATLRCLATVPLDAAGIAATLTGNVDRSTIRLHAT